MIEALVSFEGLQALAKLTSEIPGGTGVLEIASNAHGEPALARASRIAA